MEQHEEITEETPKLCWVGGDGWHPVKSSQKDYGGASSVLPTEIVNTVDDDAKIGFSRKQGVSIATLLSWYFDNSSLSVAWTLALLKCSMWRIRKSWFTASDQLKNLFRTDEGNRLKDPADVNTETDIFTKVVIGYMGTVKYLPSSFLDNCHEHCKAANVWGSVSDPRYVFEMDEVLLPAIHANQADVVDILLQAASFNCNASMNRERFFSILHSQRGFKKFGYQNDRAPPLLAAVCQKNEAVGLALLRHGVEVTVEDPSKMDALQWACREGCPQLVRTLLAKGASLVHKNASSLTCLHYAAAGTRQGVDRRVFCNIVVELIKAGAEINATATDGDTPLTLAIRCRNFDVCEELIARGADVNCPGNVNTPLIAAIVCNNEDLTERLIRREAKMDYVTSVGQWTAFTRAAREGAAGPLRKLIHYNCDVLLPHAEAGKLGLHLAAYAGNLEALTVILDATLKAGASIDVKDQSGMTALEIAVSNGFGTGAQLLIERGAVVGLPIPEYEWDAWVSSARSGYGNGGLIRLAVTSRSIQSLRAIEKALDRYHQARYHEQEEVEKETSHDTSKAKPILQGKAIIRDYVLGIYKLSNDPNIGESTLEQHLLSSNKYYKDSEIHFLFDLLTEYLIDDLTYLDMELNTRVQLLLDQYCGGGGDAKSSGEERSVVDLQVLKFFLPMDERHGLSLFQKAILRKCGPVIETMLQIASDKGFAKALANAPTQPPARLGPGCAKTPLMLAASPPNALRKFKEIAAILVAHGADPCWESVDGDSVWQKLWETQAWTLMGEFLRGLPSELTSKIDFNRDMLIDTELAGVEEDSLAFVPSGVRVPLLQAILMQPPGWSITDLYFIVNALVNIHGADPFFLGPTGLSPLHLVCGRELDPGMTDDKHIALLPIFLNFLETKPEEDRRRVLSLKTKMADRDNAKKSTADCSSLSSTAQSEESLFVCKTPLWLAIEAQKPEAIGALIRYGVDLNLELSHVFEDPSSSLSPRHGDGYGNDDAARGKALLEKLGC